MSLLSRAATLLEHPSLYSRWQRFQVAAKLAPVLRHNDLAAARRVLDVGCGPGTTTRYFAHTDYLGLDIDPGYIRYAQRKHAQRFLCADARTYVPDSTYDFVLLNSLLHHIDDEGARKILTSMHGALEEDGRINIIDLVLPARPGVARFLAESDRGDYPRPFEAWRAMFSEVFEPEVCETFTLGAGVTLWELVYFKGRRRA